ncbi:MAG: hypothetical protein HOP11_13160 [Saprospiraceae bacterium]|nr:hypothetical protein [Saprospiraceae bacterium]
MLKLFRRNILLNTLLLLPYIFVVHSGRFFVNYDQAEYSHSWLFQKITQSLSVSDQNYFYFSHILIFLQAYILNVIANRVKIVPEGQLFPGLVFIILTGLHTSIFGVGPVLISNLFFVLALHSICSIYLNKNAILQLYNFGFFLGIACVFYLPASWFLVLGIFGLTVFRGFNLKEFLQTLSGFFTPIFLLFSLFYINNSLDIYWNNQVKEFFSPYILSMIFTSKGLIAFSIIILLFILAFVKFNLFQIKTQIAAQKFFDFMFWTSLISFFSILFFKIDSFSHIIFLITPLSILLGVIVSKVKNELLVETIHLIFVLLGLFLQLQNW